MSLKKSRRAPIIFSPSPFLTRFVWINSLHFLNKKVGRLGLLSLGAVDAEPSSAEVVALEDAASEAVAAVVGYLVLGLL